MSSLGDVIEAIELHAVQDLRKYFSEGVDPNDLFNGIPLIYELTSEYARSPLFKECVRAFVDHGLVFEDKALLAVLLDDGDSLNKHITQYPETVTKRYSLKCAYTPMDEVTLLHICAEFNHVATAQVLISHGADVNTRAGTDENGFGGQTPVFHTVNQNQNQSIDMLNLLLSMKADLQITVPGLIWGKGYPWETLIPSVNPISYAMMGLLPQMHRREETISGIVTTLLKQAYGIDYKPKNVPCAYLKK
ncbi:ankyrin repeat domain-containing protein [Fulvivirgaceae bacterium PWU4]|uniref:Ankyrin repeat domain-containing protein n=1 Tax=Chryseosolibacter histidini TaxID=2782349 RepID=A0AAP2DGQ9_9BACT|nr:ankyrin repeat domain-containing protein [Chryseosolibacter histidini]MBT1696005.1 ankyrin repeat domain-containing protein [Chryseosolibacter histidini]